MSKKEFDTWPITVGDGRRQIQQFIFTALPGTAGSTWQGSINGGQQYSHEILIDGIADRTHGSGGRREQRVQPVGGIDQRIQAADRHDERAVHRRPDGGRQLRHQVRHERAARLGVLLRAERRLARQQLQQQCFRVPRQPFKQHNYGYSVGGPVYLPKIYNGRNRTFFFHNLERTKLKDYSQSGFATLPIPAFKKGDFSSLFNAGFTGNAASGTSAGTDADGRAGALRRDLRSVDDAAGGQYLGSRRVPRQHDSA